MRLHRVCGRGGWPVRAGLVVAVLSLLGPPASPAESREPGQGVVQLVAVSGAVSLLLVGFMAAMLRAWSLDLGIDCGCFGIGQAVSPETLARDGALTLLSLGVTVGAIVSRRRATLPATRLGAEVEAPGGQACTPRVARGEAPTAAGAWGAADEEARP